MDIENAEQNLRDAERISARARQAGQWYCRFLIAYAIASFLLAIGFALVGPRWGALLITPLWMIFVVAISVYAARQRAAIRGLTRIHTLMILGWSIAWVLTLSLSFPLHQAWWWWLLGGLLMATPPVIAFRHVRRQVER